jgi:hypothetical protein
MRALGGGRSAPTKAGGVIVEPVWGHLVSHSNARTDYELIEHGYQPAECDECARIAAMFGGAEWAC